MGIAGGYGTAWLFTSTAMILVLYILLVIILQTF
ncbi:YjcZ family sporulation protein [Xylanibacillus composti]|nr:YjcZ family sporulation protein [Xylanibacillus composti]